MYDLSRTLALKLPYLPSLTSPLQQLLICFNQFIMGRTHYAGSVRFTIRG